jgi:hypothetical protein
MTEPYRDPTDRIGKQLDGTSDPTLLILRAHLLVEELLRDIVDRACQAPDELAPARLSFYQAYCLCRAIVGKSDDRVWGFIARLNEVRNRMAHHLEPGDLDELVGSVATTLRLKYPGARTPVDRVRFATYYACGFLQATGGSVRLGPAYAPEEEPDK